MNELPDEDVLIWDINWGVFNLFHAMSTQWRVGGMGSATGLDYGVVPTVGEMLGYKKKEVNAMFPDLQVMENEALITMGENIQDGDNS